MSKRIGISVLAIGLFLFVASCFPSGFHPPFRQFFLAQQGLARCVSSASSLRANRVPHFRLNRNGLIGSGGSFHGLPTGVGRPLFGFFGWDGASSLWYGTSGGDGDSDDGDGNCPTPVSAPEPGTLLLLASGSLMLIGFRHFETQTADRT